MKCQYDIYFFIEETIFSPKKIPNKKIRTRKRCDEHVRNSKFLSTDSGSLIKGVVFTTGPFLTLKSRVMAISGIELFCDAKIEGDSCSSDSGKRQNDDCFTGRPFISLEKETL